MGLLSKITRITEQIPGASEAAAYQEMRHARADAQYARENTLARIQLTRHLPR